MFIFSSHLFVIYLELSSNRKKTYLNNYCMMKMLPKPIKFSFSFVSSLNSSKCWLSHHNYSLHIPSQIQNAVFKFLLRWKVCQNPFKYISKTFIFIHIFSTCVSHLIFLSHSFTYISSNHSFIVFFS